MKKQVSIPFNILVTAVGSELAMGIIKAIRLFSVPPRLIGCDVYKEVVGKYWCDTFYEVPLAKDEAAYIQALRKMVTEESIRVIIPSADVEYDILSRYRDIFQTEYGCHILVNSTSEIERFNDKWLAYEWYIAHALRTPRTCLADNIDVVRTEIPTWTYPMVVKPRTGGGSRHVYRIDCFQDIERYLPVVPKPILQEYLFPDDAEYTVGTYRTNSNKVLAIVLKRTLKFGMTNTAEVCKDPKLEEFARDIILKSNLVGSNNIQLRATEIGPKILEINPRFSGTAGIRAAFGFNDVEMWVNETVQDKEPVQPVIKTGFVLRHMEEQYHFGPSAP